MAITNINSMETPVTDADRVYQLTKELSDMVAKKKASAKAYNEEVKRLKGEIEDLISDDEPEKITT